MGNLFASEFDHRIFCYVPPLGQTHLAKCSESCFSDEPKANCIVEFGLGKKYVPPSNKSMDQQLSTGIDASQHPITGCEHRTISDNRGNSGRVNLMVQRTKIQKCGDPGDYCENPAKKICNPGINRENFKDAKEATDLSMQTWNLAIEKGRQKFGLKCKSEVVKELCECNQYTGELFVKELYTDSRWSKALSIFNIQKEKFLKYLKKHGAPSQTVDRVSKIELKKDFQDCTIESGAFTSSKGYIHLGGQITLIDKQPEAISEILLHEFTHQLDFRKPDEPQWDLEFFNQDCLNQSVATNLAGVRDKQIGEIKADALAAEIWGEDFQFQTPSIPAANYNKSIYIQLEKQPDWLRSEAWKITSKSLVHKCFYGGSLSNTEREAEIRRKSYNHSHPHFEDRINRAILSNSTLRYNAGCAQHHRAQCVSSGSAGDPCFAPIDISTHSPPLYYPLYCGDANVMVERPNSQPGDYRLNSDPKVTK